MRVSKYFLSTMLNMCNTLRRLLYKGKYPQSKQVLTIQGKFKTKRDGQVWVLKISFLIFDKCKEHIGSWLTEMLWLFMFKISKIDWKVIWTSCTIQSILVWWNCRKKSELNTIHISIQLNKSSVVCLQSLDNFAVKRVFPKMPPFPARDMVRVDQLSPIEQIFP